MSRMESTTTDTAADLIPPHGGRLVDLLAGPERAAELKAASRDWPSWDLTPRQLCDLELLLNGGFSPLTGFMGRADYESVCATMRLADGTLWPIPITLDVPDELAEKLGRGRVARAARPRGRDARRAPRRGASGEPDREARGAGGLRHHRLEAPRAWPTCSTARTPCLRGRPARGPAAARPLRLPRPAPHAGRAARRVRARWAGAGWSPSRPATPCTARTAS